VVHNKEIQQDIVSSEIAGNELGDILFVFHYLLYIYVDMYVTETNYKHNLILFFNRHKEQHNRCLNDARYVAIMG